MTQQQLQSLGDQFVRSQIFQNSKWAHVMHGGFGCVSQSGNKSSGILWIVHLHYELIDLCDINIFIMSCKVNGSVRLVYKPLVLICTADLLEEKNIVP